MRTLANPPNSCLYVKKRNDLTDALTLTPSYLRNTFSDSGLVIDYRDWQIPLGRRFRSLKVWFILRSYGIDGIQSVIRNHIKLGDYFHSLVKSRDDLFEVLAGPAFALNVITCKPQRGAETRVALDTDGTVNAMQSGARLEANALTKQVYEHVNAQGEFYLTSAVIGGIYAIRIVSANTQTEKKYLKRCFDVLVDATETYLKSLDQVSANGAKPTN